jgi:hypothetical protein
LSDEITENDRRAIIIGIDEYEEKEKINILPGAGKDAEEIHERFIANCKFKVDNNHYLVGKKATRKNILKAVSDIFRKDTKCDLVAFYYSGHGITDPYDKKGYLAPYDMDPEDPVVSGIDMDDLKNIIFNSKNDASVLMILDCCYAGISTETNRNMLEDPKTRQLYATKLQNIVSSENDNTLEIEDSGQGKIILASSEPDAVSRERVFTHLNNDKPHSHGVFSFHLIEGLDGKAANSDTGIITIDDLRKYISKEMQQTENQQPLYAVAKGSSKLENIALGRSSDLFNKKISNLINEINDFFQYKDPTNGLIDVQALDSAAKKVGVLLDLDPNNREVPTLKTIIDDNLRTYKNSAVEWLTNNAPFARLKINRIGVDFLFYNKLFDDVGYLSFNSLLKAEESSTLILVHLFSEVGKNTMFTSIQDEKLENFVGKLRHAYNMNKNLKG